MKTIQKILIVLGFAIPMIIFSTVYIVLANGEIELIVAVSAVMFVANWITVEGIRAGIKSIK